MRLALTIALVGASLVPARAAEIDIHDAIDIARNVCRVDLGETDAGPAWRAERLGASWRVRGGETYEVWVRASDGKASVCQACAHESAVDDAPCIDRDGKRPEGW